MKTIRILSLVLIAAFGGQSFARSNPRVLIQANYDNISKLSMTREKKKLERLARKNASTSFQYVDAMRNSLDIAATIRQNNEQLSLVYKFNSNSNKIIGVKHIGNDLMLTVKTTYDVYMDPDLKKRVVGTTVSQDTWIKTLKGWKIRKSKIMKESAMLNGNRIS